MKIKENEKIDKYLNLIGELKKLLNLKVTVIPIIVGALGMVLKAWKEDREGWRSEEKIETFQTTALL